jgi:hypothetical protein
MSIILATHIDACIATYNTGYIDPSIHAYNAGYRDALIDAYNIGFFENFTLPVILTTQTPVSLYFLPQHPCQYYWSKGPSIPPYKKGNIDTSPPGISYWIYGRQ